MPDGACPSRPTRHSQKATSPSHHGSPRSTARAPPGGSPPSPARRRATRPQRAPREKEPGTGGGGASGVRAKGRPAVGSPVRSRVRSSGTVTALSGTVDRDRAPRAGGRGHPTNAGALVVRGRYEKLGTRWRRVQEAQGLVIQSARSPPPRPWSTRTCSTSPSPRRPRLRPHQRRHGDARPGVGGRRDSSPPIDRSLWPSNGYVHPAPRRS